MSMKFSSQPTRSRRLRTRSGQFCVGTFIYSSRRMATPSQAIAIFKREERWLSAEDAGSHPTTFFRNESESRFAINKN